MKGKFMKHIKKEFCLLLFISFILNLNVKAVSKWDVKRENLENTTSGIKSEFIKETDTLIYTIPEEYDKKGIYINISEDISKITGGKYVPGDSKPFTIKIVNNSKYTYNYLKNSFKVVTDDMSKIGDSNSYYSYNSIGLTNGIYIKDSKSFDGQQIAAEWSIKRTLNDAIKKLYLFSPNIKKEKINNVWKYVYYFADGTNCNFGLGWRANICKQMLTDEVLDREIKDQGYANGILDLNKYYLNYYNKLFKTNAKTLEELPDKAIYGYANSTSEYLGGILNGNFYANNETNSEVSELGYNWFYNKGLGLYPIYDENGNELNAKNTKDKNFYIGNYMRNESPITENVVSKDFAIIESKSEYSLTPIMMLIDFNYVVNAHSNMEFGFNIKFELTRENTYGKLIVNYIDNDGNKLIDSIISEEEVDTSYKTEQKEFTGFEFLKVEGNTEGKYIDGVIEVTYIYKKIPTEVVITNDGEYDDDILPPHTETEIEFSNIIMYIENNKKRKNKLAI